jgi:chemotaxis protein methyltransferase CheR
MIELSVVDTRTVIRAIKEKKKFDLSDFALTSLKYRLAKLMLQYKFNSIDVLIDKIEEQEDFYDTFIHDLLVPSTEMFRDPSLWRWLREEHFENVKDKMIGNNFRIWFPLTVDGYEVHTMAVVLKEMDLLDSVKIYVSVLSDRSIEEVKKGLISVKKYDISSENYKRYKGTASLDDYVSRIEYSITRDKDLIKNVEFIKQDSLFENAPANVKLVMFRNYCIYFSPGMQEKLINNLYDTMAPTGHLILGNKERIKNISSSSKFEIVNDGESVFKKKFNS